MNRNLDTTLIRTFVAAADHGSMTVVSNVLHMTQSAVSQQIKRLEETLDCILFEREKRGLRLTEAGERLLGNARRMLILNDTIWADMTERAVDGEVRLGLPYDLVGAGLVSLLKSYSERFPNVDISLVCGSSPELKQKLVDGMVDLCVIEEPLDTIGGECLAVDRLVWVGAHAGNAHRKTPLPLSMVTDTCAFRPSVFAALSESGRRWRTVFEHGNIEATAATVRTDLAVTAWLASTVPPDLDILSTADGLPDLPSFAINLHTARREGSAAIRELARHIRDGLVRTKQAAE
jgi:DNA-binding transcriptional LysR family regulator